MSMVLCQVGCGVTIFIPQGGVRVVGDQGLAALRGGVMCDCGGTRHAQVLTPSPPHRWETETEDLAQNPATIRCRMESLSATKSHPVLAAWHQAPWAPASTVLDGT